VSLFLFQFKEDNDNIFIVMEYLRGGELYDRIFKERFLKEVDSRDILHALTEAVAYLHKHGVRPLIIFQLISLNFHFCVGIKIID
jgi:serine/threonine protein kinase